MDHIPIVASVEDLPGAIAAASENPTARWYVAKMASSLRQFDALPADWDEAADPVLAASRFFSAETRREHAKKGIALPDGSFPIPDRDALRRAIATVGRASNYERAKRHIIKRARALNAIGALPEAWAVTASSVAEDDAMVAEMLRLQMDALK